MHHGSLILCMKDRQRCAHGHRGACGSVFECPQELLRMQLREREFSHYGVLVFYIWGRVKKYGKMLNGPLIEKVVFLKFLS